MLPPTRGGPGFIEEVREKVRIALAAVTDDGASINNATLCDLLDMMQLPMEEYVLAGGSEIDDDNHPWWGWKQGPCYPTDACMEKLERIDLREKEMRQRDALLRLPPITLAAGDFPALPPKRAGGGGGGP